VTTHSNETENGGDVGGRGWRGTVRWVEVCVCVEGGLYVSRCMYVHVHVYVRVCVYLNVLVSVRHRTASAEDDDDDEEEVVESVYV
jgi:hypothetical protein